MTASILANPASRSRPFTAFAWLLWAVMPSAAIYAIRWILEHEMELPSNGGPGGAIGVAILGLLLWFGLVSVVATLQWLILRRTWPKTPWLWPAWLFASLICLVVWIVFLRKQDWAVVIFTIGFAPAVVLTCASPKGLRLAAFIALFTSFSSGATLAWVIQRHWHVPYVPPAHVRDIFS